jgi:hypothetical protein
MSSREVLLIISGIVVGVILFFFRITRWHAWWNGWRDGRKGIPHATQSFPPQFENRLIAYCHIRVFRFAQR